MLGFDLPTLENDDRGDRADAKFGGDAGRLVDVDLANLGFAYDLVGKLFYDWGEHFTGATPRGAEVNQHGHRALEYFLFKVRVVEVEDVCSHGANLGRPIGIWQAVLHPDLHFMCEVALGRRYGDVGLAKVEALQVAAASKG